MATIKVFKSSDRVLFRRAYGDSASIDLSSNEPKAINLLPCDCKLIRTGVFVELPNKNIEGQIRSKSELSLQGVIVLNSPATIDWNYRGELIVLLINLGEQPIQIKPNDIAIAELVFVPIIFPTFEIVENVNELSISERNSKSFGSSN